MEITLKLLGERLKEIRKAMGMLQEDVAKHLDVNQNAISRIENGVGGGDNKSSKSNKKRLILL